MHKLTALSALLVLILLAGCGSKPAEFARGPEALTAAILKVVRLEQQAHAADSTAVAPELQLADSLMAGLILHIPRECLGQYAETDSSACDSLIDPFLAAAAALDDPQEDRDPAAAITYVLRSAPRSMAETGRLIDGYGAAFQVMLEGRRELPLRLMFIEFMLKLGVPVTYRDLGLEEAPEGRLQELAAQAAERTLEQPYPTETEDFLIAMQRMSDVGSRFGAQQDPAGMAAKLMTTPEFQALREPLAGLDSLTLAFFGDSQTDQRHWSSPAHYPELVRAVFAEINPQVSVINAGIGGDDTNDGLARIEPDLLAKQPDLTFILFGGNDSAFWGRDHSTVSPEQFRANIAEMVTRLGQVGSRVVLLSYPRIPEFGEREYEVLQAMNAELVELRDSLGTGWIDAAGMFAENEPRRMFAADMIHYSPRAHEMLAMRIFEHLVREGAERSKE